LLFLAKTAKDAKESELFLSPVIALTFPVLVQFTVTNTAIDYKRIPIFRQVKEGKRLCGGVAALRCTRKRAA